MRDRHWLRPAAWTLCLVACVAAAAADVWDPWDNSWSSDNELVHGSEQLHELGRGGHPGSSRDLDFYRIGQAPLSSYEVVVDGATNQIVEPGLLLERYEGFTLVQTAGPTHPQVGWSRSLRWQNTFNTSLSNAYIRVTSRGDCTLYACVSNRAVYFIRAYDTTYSLPRFNNSATQKTVLLIQNSAGHPVAGGLHFLDPGGNVLGTQPFSLASRRLLVLDTSIVPFAGTASGSIVVTHDGRYGDLTGKAVALEPATGFTFDTPLVPRPR